MSSRSSLRRRGNDGKGVNAQTVFTWHDKLHYKIQIKKTSSSYVCYNGFSMNDLHIKVGDCVLIRAGEEDEKDVYDVGRLLHCYDTKSRVDNLRGRVQWYSRINDLPMVQKLPLPEDLAGDLDGDREVVQENRNYSRDIDLETIVATCIVEECDVTVDPSTKSKLEGASGMYFLCRLSLEKKSAGSSNKVSLNKITKYTSKDFIDPTVKIIYPPGKENIPPGLEIITNSGRKPKRQNVNEEEDLAVSPSRKSRLAGENCSSSAVKSLASSASKKTPNRNLGKEFDDVEHENVSTKCVEKKVKRNVLMSKHSRVKTDDIQSLLDAASSGSESDFEELEDLDKEPVKSSKLRKSTTVKTFTCSMVEGESRPGTPIKLSIKTREVICESPRSTPTKGRRMSRVGTPSKQCTPSKRGTPSKVGTPSKLSTPSKVGTPKSRVSICTPSRRGTSTVTPLNGTPSRTRSFICPHCKASLRSKHDLEDHLQDEHDVYEMSPDKSPTPKKTAKRSTKLPSTPKSTYSCDECDKTYVKEKTLMNHKAKEHKTDKKTPKKTPSKSLTSKENKLTTGQRSTATSLKSLSSLEEARARLHVSAVPESLPCREEQCAELFEFVHSRLLDGTGGCIYISGVPGTGKTATVKEVVRMLRNCEEEGDLPHFTFIEVNALRLAQPRQIWVEVWSSLTGNRSITADHACTLLEKRFRKPGPRRAPTVLLVDELDLLWTRKQDVLYNLFEWPGLPSSQLIVVAIANTMDLPERVMMARVSSRLGLTRLTFHPYTHHQLMEIVLSRLTGIDNFECDAIQLVSRKVAAVSGDARRALDIIRRASELAETDECVSPSKRRSPSKQRREVTVAMKHVDSALQEMFMSPKIMAIRNCSKTEQQTLRAIVTEFHRTGLEETCLERVFDQYQCISACEEQRLKKVTLSSFCAVLSRLSGQRLIITEATRKYLTMRISLNLSVSDVQFALNSKNA